MSEWEPTTQPWIVCAANKYGDLIIAGARHHDSIMRSITAKIGGGDWKKGFDILMGDNWKENGSCEEQGFIDQFGRFYTREDACRLAVQNGQMEAQRNGENCDYLVGSIMCSEDLY